MLYITLIYENKLTKNTSKCQKNVFVLFKNIKNKIKRELKNTNKLHQKIINKLK